jgi:putative ABC transport system substrate-binding protein
MKRREFIALLGGVAAWPVAVRAQQLQRVQRIGILMGVADDAETKDWLVTFNQRLEQLGWQAGRNLQIDERWTGGDPERTRLFAGELLAIHPDAVFAFSSIAVAALQRESRTVPIVFAAISDPVGSGFVQSRRTRAVSLDHLVGEASSLSGVSRPSVLAVLSLRQRRCGPQKFKSLSKNYKSLSKKNAVSSNVSVSDK